MWRRRLRAPRRHRRVHARESERDHPDHHHQAAGLSSNIPTITWTAPAAIAYGAALSATQLNATANVPGTFAYTPAAGTVLKAGTQTLSAVFTPADTSAYSSATATVQLGGESGQPGDHLGSAGGHHARRRPRRSPTGRHCECARCFTTILARAMFPQPAR